MNISFISTSLLAKSTSNSANHFSYSVALIPKRARRIIVPLLNLNSPSSSSKSLLVLDVNPSTLSVGEYTDDSIFTRLSNHRWKLLSLLRRCSFPPSKKASAGVFSCAIAAVPNIRQEPNNNNFAFCILFDN